MGQLCTISFYYSFRVTLFKYDASKCIPSKTFFVKSSQLNEMSDKNAFQ